MTTNFIATRATAFFAALILGIVIMMGTSTISRAQSLTPNAHTSMETGWHSGGGGHWGGHGGGHR